MYGLERKIGCESEHRAGTEIAACTLSLRIYYHPRIFFERCDIVWLRAARSKTGGLWGYLQPFATLLVLKMCTETPLRLPVFRAQADMHCVCVDVAYLLQARILAHG